MAMAPIFPYADGWLGGDGALSVQLSGRRVLWIFSDSYVSANPRAGSRKEAETIVGNTIALSSYTRKSAQIRYYWRKNGKEHRAFFASGTPGRRYWPVWAFLRNDSVFVFLQQVGPKEIPVPDDVFNFRLTGIDLAVLTRIASKDPLQWNIDLVPYSAIFPEDTWTQAGTDEDYLYVFKNDRQGNFLTRIPLDKLMSPGGSTEYFSNENRWEKGTTGEDRHILFREQANGSLAYYPDLQNWIYVYGPNFLSNEIRYRYAADITGPWSEGGTLCVTPEQTPGDPAYDQRYFCYLARAHAAFYDAVARKFLVTYDCNSTDFAQAAASDFIYIPRVRWIPAPASILEGH